MDADEEVPAQPEPSGQDQEPDGSVTKDGRNSLGQAAGPI